MARPSLAMIVTAVAAAGIVAAFVTDRSDLPPAGSSSLPTTTPLPATPPTTAPTYVIAADTAAPVAKPSTTDDGLNLLGGDSPEDKRMPDVICMGLQDAQDEIQDHGVFFSKSVDATGEGRRQILDRNWVVVDQDPKPGEQIGEGDAVLSVVKKDEPNDCP